MAITKEGAMGVLQIVQLGATIALAVLGFMLNREQQVFSQSISEIETQLKVRQDDRAAAESAEKLRFQLFAHVSSSLEKKENSVQQQQAAKALVVSLLRDDDLLRIGLLEALSAQAAPGIKQELEQVASQEREYRAQEDALAGTVASVRKASASTSSSGLKGYLIDVFYCAKDEAAYKQRAEAAAEFLAGKGISHRVRPLAETVNASPGMRVSGLQLRYNGDELAIAQSLRQLLGEGKQGDFVLREIRKPTPNYLSVFLCA